MTELLVIVLLGGFVALDATSFPQMMISRPLVAGALTGFVLGDPIAGALVGGLLEVFHLSVLPIGAARYPEGGTAAVVATAAYVHAALVPIDGPALLLALVLALFWGRVAGLSAVWLRHGVDWFAIVEPAAAPSPRTIEGRHLLAMSADFGRGCVLVGVGAPIGALLVGAGSALWGMTPSVAHVALSIGSAAALGSGLSVFGGWHKHAILFLAGTLAGATLLLIA